MIFIFTDRLQSPPILLYNEWKNRSGDGFFTKARLFQKSFLKTEQLMVFP